MLNYFADLSSGFRPPNQLLHTSDWTEFSFLFVLQLVVREPTDPSHKFEWGSLYMLTGDYMEARECFHDAVSVQQAHRPRLEVLRSAATNTYCP